MAALAKNSLVTSSVEFDAQLIKKLSQLGPRYTSYPTADRFTDAFTAEDYRQAVARVRERGAPSPRAASITAKVCSSGWMRLTAFCTTGSKSCTPRLIRLNP